MRCLSGFFSPNLCVRCELTVSARLATIQFVHVAFCWQFAPWGSFRSSLCLSTTGCCACGWTSRLGFKQERTNRPNSLKEAFSSHSCWSRKMHTFQVACFMWRKMFDLMAARKSTSEITHWCNVTQNGNLSRQNVVFDLKRNFQHFLDLYFGFVQWVWTFVFPWQRGKAMSFSSKIGCFQALLADCTCTLMWTSMNFKRCSSLLEFTSDQMVLYQSGDALKEHT